MRELTKLEDEAWDKKREECKKCKDFHYNSDCCGHEGKWEKCYPEWLVRAIKEYSDGRRYCCPSEPGTRPSIPASCYGFQRSLGD